MVSWETFVILFLPILLICCFGWLWLRPRKRTEDLVPTCFNSYPGPQQEAEYGCATCKLYNCCSRG